MNFKKVLFLGAALCFSTRTFAQEQAADCDLPLTQS